MANWHFEPMSGRGIRYIIDNIDNIEKTLKKVAGIAISTAKDPEVNYVEIEIPGILNFQVNPRDNKKDIAQSMLIQYKNVTKPVKKIDIDKNLREQVKTTIKNSPDFKNIDEFVSAMQNVQPINVLSKDLKIEQATEWASKIMHNLIRCGTIIKDINNEDRKKFASAMKNAGAIKTSKIKNVDPKIADDYGRTSSSCYNNIFFPLCIFGQTLNNKSNFDFWLNECINGKENSWGAQWLIVQENYNQQVKTKDDIENE